MSARAGDGDFEAVRRDALRGDVFGGSAVDGDNGGEARAVTFHQRANAAQVAFAFFADVAREDDRFRRVDARFGERAREAGERGEACAVVGDARSGEAVAMAFHADIGAGGKNRVQMRGEQNDALCICARTLGDYVAGLIHANFQARGFEEIFSDIRRAGLPSNSGAGISVR